MDGHLLPVKKLALAILAVLTLARTESAFAHARWISPTPRDQQDGYKPGRSPGFVLPCGVGRKPTQATTTLAAGSMQMVEWEETINHPGCFLVEFGATDAAAATFQQLAVLKHPETRTQKYQTMVKLPDQECTGCVLRLRQVMLTNNTQACPPANLPDLSPDLYYSCANVTLKRGGGGTPDGSAPLDAGSDGFPTTDGWDAAQRPVDAASSPGGAPGSAGGTGGSGGTGGTPSVTPTGGSGGMTGGRSEESGGNTGEPSDKGAKKSSGGCAVGVGGGAGSAAPAIVLLVGVLLAGAGRRSRRSSR